MWALRCWPWRRQPRLHPADESGVMSPIEWARRAVHLAIKFWNGDRILAEVNNGGALVEAQLRAILPRLPFKAVHASRGKVVRAEPIAALFEQGRAHVVGTFPKLEDQLCTFSAGSSDSPDRLDAMVWGLSELALNARRGELVFGGIGKPDELEVARTLPEHRRLPLSAPKPRRALCSRPHLHGRDLPCDQARGVDPRASACVFDGTTARCAKQTYTRKTEKFRFGSTWLGSPKSIGAYARSRGGSAGKVGA